MAMCRRPVTQTLLSVVFAVLILGQTRVSASQGVAASPEDIDFFESKVRPLLIQRCYECHSHEKKIKGGLALDSKPGWQTGGDNGPVIVPGDLGKSLLIKAVHYRDADFEMPPKGKLPASEIAILEQWIKLGAPDPRSEAIATAKPARTIDIAEGKKFWAFQPVNDPPKPAVKNTSWPLDSIDHFVLAGLEASSLSPVNDTDRYTWLRRVSLDLTGLPPSPEEIDSFLKDESPGAFASVVDHLLDSRAYGERWARHWLDLTGYADMVGTSNDVFAEHAWRYRDYLISAFNQDKPFDEFIREQIAGDLLPAASTEDRAENITATGFFLVGDIEIVNPDKAKMEADLIDTQMIKLGTAFMGQTLGCVRCHDHKFDPITLGDYYGIAGMLRSSPSTHKIPFGVWSMPNSTVLPETQAQLGARGVLEAKKQQKINKLKAEQTALKQIEATAEGKAKEEAAAKLKTLATEIQHAEFFKPQVPKALAMRDGSAPADMPVYIRGNPYAPGPVMPRSVVQVASWEALPPIPAGQSGRLQLANWLADERHPLTARVAVNRIWQKLFGEGIVRSVDYFGVRGELPTHPELLDHLATRFMRLGWSQKQLIRSLVLSRTYRMSSANHPAGLELDPENKRLWRMNRQRLDAEALRDSLLAVSGELIRDSSGPALVLEKVENTGALVQQGVNPPNYRHRVPRPSQEFDRTIYLPVLRNGPTHSDKLRTLFDFVDPAMIAGQRNQSVVPTQLLFLLNNELVRKRSGVIATQLLADPGLETMEEKLAALWLRVYNRPITTIEREDARAFLSINPAQMWQELCHSLLASNQFIYRL